MLLKELALTCNSGTKLIILMKNIDKTKLNKSQIERINATGSFASYYLQNFLNNVLNIWV